MSNKNDKTQMNHACGLLIIEVRESNPNGDPDREGDPRQRPDERGKISPVSLKRKIRDLVQADLTEDDRGPVWSDIAGKMNITPDDFCILENRNRDRTTIKKMAKEEFQTKYWDARVFGNTFLESIKDDKGKNKNDNAHFIRTGVVQFGVGVSIAPVEIERDTITNKSGVEDGKDRGMAPLGMRYVQHGVYCMPFFVNPSAAIRSGCSKQDIDVLLRLIPYAYSHNPSMTRRFVGIRHAWYMEHKSPLGSCSDFTLIDALTPKRTGDDPDQPSTSWENYDVPTDLPDELKSKLADFRDLMDQLEHNV